MKKIFTIFLMVAGIYMAGQSQGVIPNGDFEQWTDSVTNPTWGSISIAPIMFVLPNGYYAMKRTADKHAGTYAAKLVAGSFQANALPGVTTLGVVNLATQNITGGKPFTDRPQKIKFWYKYQPVSGDTMTVYAVLLKRNGSATDTVAAGIFHSTAAVTSYTQAEFTMYYKSQTMIPDTINFVAMTASSTSHDGSTLFIDDVTTFGVFVGIPENAATAEISIAPNPSTGIINIETGLGNASSVKVINAIGQVVYTSNFNDKKSINLHHLPKGIYVAEIIAGEKRSVKRFVLK